MADLDDFFAKKDKKKPKGKKFTTTEEIAKKLEERKPDKIKKDKSSYQSSITGQGSEDNHVKNKDDEEEWGDFAEAERKDYTGLKIQNLSIQQPTEEESEQCEEGDVMEENEQGEMVRRKKGPWRAMDSDAQQETKIENAPPPARALYQVRARQRQEQAPDIMNTENFPSLSATTNETPVSWGRKKNEGVFEEVRNSKSHSNRSDTRENRSLEIGNKFGALQSENS